MSCALRSIALFVFLACLGIAAMDQAERAAAVPDANGFWAVEDVRAGMKAIGKTCVKGTRIETFDAEMLSIYGKGCGWVLARAHAKAGDPWTISGYLGKNDQFEEAMGKFALAYADQAERDHAALKTAVRAGIVDVQLER